MTVFLRRENIVAKSNQKRKRSALYTFGPALVLHGFDEKEELVEVDFGARGFEPS